MNHTMLAAIAESAQAPLVLRHIARPIPGKGQVLVKVHAAGVNPLDSKIASGTAAHARQPLPAVLGLDLAGTVIEYPGATRSTSKVHINIMYIQYTSVDLACLLIYQVSRVVLLQ